MYSLYKYKFEEGKIELKWLYIKHKEEFIRKFKQKFPDAGDDEIKNFIRIYLKPAFSNEKNDLRDFMFFDKDGDEWPVNRICFFGIYLKELHVDNNYGWFLENNEPGLHFP